MRHEFSAQITPSREFVFNDKAQWDRFKTTQKPGGYMVSLRKAGPPRKLNQNALYWARCEVLCTQPEIGLTKDGLHAWLMQEAGYGEKKEFKGRTIFDRESSASLTIEEFSRLMHEQDKLAEFCNEGRPPEHYVELPTT